MDTMTFEILEDGTLIVKTSEISPGNHMSADKLLAEMEQLMGGQTTKQKNPDAHGRQHTHQQATTGRK